LFSGSTYLRAAKDIVAEQGLSGLMRGITPKYFGNTALAFWVTLLMELGKDHHDNIRYGF